MKLIKFMPAAALLFGTHAALANPVVCSAGNQDSSCLQPIRSDPIPAPGCPGGYSQTSAPVWQGSGWSQPGCTPPPPPPPVTVPPPPPPPDQKAFCVNYSLAHGFYKGGLGSKLWRLIGPVPGVGTSAFTTKAYQSVPGAGSFDPSSSDPAWIGTGSFNPPNVPTDMIYFNNGVINVCYFTPGTVNLIGYMNGAGSSYDGGGG